NCGTMRNIASCGTCAAPKTCGGGGMTNVCGCMAENNAAFCTRLMKNCNMVTAMDNCGTSRTANCGTCTAPQPCGGGGAVANVCGGPVLGTTYALVARHSSSCLDVPMSSMTSGADLQQYMCNMTGAQQFQLAPGTPAGAYIIRRTVNTGLCV